MQGVRTQFRNNFSSHPQNQKHRSHNESSYCRSAVGFIAGQCARCIPPLVPALVLLRLWSGPQSSKFSKGLACWPGPMQAEFPLEAGHKLALADTHSSFNAGCKYLRKAMARKLANITWALMFLTFSCGHPTVRLLKKHPLA